MNNSLRWILLPLLLFAQLCAAQQPALSGSKPQAPVVAYVDLIAAPNRGGENGLGAYVSIFGKNFGTDGAGTRTRVTIGGVEVAAYRYFGPSLGRSDIQQITVQAGELGGARPGVPLPVQVSVDGVLSNSNHTFTIQPGNILFVDNVDGKDSRARPNDIQRPWRRVQSEDGEGGALAAANPGDVLVLRGKKTWTDTGLNERWFRFRYATGKAPTGKPGTGYLAITAYPGEPVRFVPPPGTRGGIHGIDGRGYPGYSQWIAISGLRIEGGDRSVVDGPINLQAVSNHWRIVNNEIGPWDAEDGSKGPEARSAGIVGNGRNVAILGNRIHHIGGGKLNHCIYLDTGAVDVEIGFNHLHDCNGNIIQLFDNLGMEDLERIDIHHNLMHDGQRYGLNIADGTVSARVWNNVLYNTAFASVRLNVAPGEKGDISITHNSFASPNLGRQALNAPVLNTWKLEGKALIANNVFMLGENSQPDNLFINDGSGVIDFRRNAWLAPKERWTAPDKDAVFATVAATRAGDGAMSDRLALLGSGITTDLAVKSSVESPSDDFLLAPRPLGAAADIGAFECCSR